MSENGATVNTDISRPLYEEGDVITPEIQRQLRNVNMDPGMVGETITADDAFVLNQSTGTYDQFGVTQGLNQNQVVTGGSDETAGNTVTAGDINNANAQAGAANGSNLGDAIPTETSEGAVPTTTGAGRSPSDAEWQQFYKEVNGRHNLLHDLNTYNYIIVLTSLSKEQLADPTTYKGKTFDSEVASDFHIISRTGGYKRSKADQVSVGEVTTDPMWKKDGIKGDLFIENLTFDTRIGVNDMGNSNLTRGSFEVIEPHSVGTFYEELWAASRTAGHENYIQAPFLLTISFLGRKPDVDEAIRPDKTTRHLPIMITGSEMSVDEGGAKYTVQFMGYNSVGAGLTRSSLWDDIQPYINPNGESVEAILMSAFYKNTQAYTKVLEDMESGLTQQQKDEIQSKIGQTEIVSGALAGGTSNVDAWIPNEYYVWFADGYGGNFPRSGSELSAMKSQWNGHVQRIMGQTIPPSMSEQTLSPPTFTNTFGQAGLNDKVTPTANINVVPYENALEAAREEKAEVDRLVGRQRGIIERQLRIVERSREQLARLEISSRGDPTEDLEPDLVQDLTVQADSKTDELLTAVEEAKNDAVNLSNSLISGDGPDAVPAANSQLTADEVQLVVAIRKRIQDAQEAIVNATNALKDLEGRATAAQDGLEAVRTRAAQGYDLTSSGVQWSFRKGSNLFGIIDTLIINSQKMEMFQDDSQLNNMATSEYIPWYKTEIYTHIIGFDVATMNFAYEFHYVVTPYQVHYSKLPGVNIVFSTKKLRERAVREYNYIFTGKNLDVLRFDIKYNNLFQTPLLLTPPSETALQGRNATEEVENSNIPRTAYEEAIENLSNRISNHLGTTGFTPAQAVEKMNYRDLAITNRSHIGLALKEFLYNPPAELALIRADVEIIGDPVYIIGSGIAERPKLGIHDILTPDGEVNGFTREPDILFNFRYPEDIPSKSQLQAKPTQKLKEGAYNGVYQVLGVENRFAEGAFTQTLQLLRRKNQEQDYKVDERFKTEGIDFDTPT